MRARDFAFWLAFALAGPSFAQNAAYSQFPAASADSCAKACTSDRMCASWSFGGAVATGETTSRSKKKMGPSPRMCALSQSLSPSRQPGFESGLPRRTAVLTPTGRYGEGSGNYEVRPAPWLDPRARAPQAAPGSNQGAPIAPPPAPPAARMEFSPQAAPRPAAPVEASQTRSGARGTPRSSVRDMPSQQPPQAAFDMPQAPAALAAPMAAPTPPQMSFTPPPAPPAMPAAPPMQSPAPAQQATDLSKFRGSDGMVDAAAMRRAQINSARATGQPAYAVQREWEAVEQERQRAAANGEVRPDPLAGTVPVPQAPQPRSTKPSQSFEPDPSSLGGEEESANPDAQKPASKPRGARGTPRAEQSTSSRQSALNQAARDRARNPSYIDREPRLGGGPGG